MFQPHSRAKPRPRCRRPTQNTPHVYCLVFLFVSVEFSILLVCFIEFVCFDFCGFLYFLFLSGARSLLGNDIGSIWEEFEEGKEYDQNKFYKISLLNESNTLHSKFSWFLNSFWIDI